MGPRDARARRTHARRPRAFESSNVHLTPLPSHHGGEETGGEETGGEEKTRGEKETRSQEETGGEEETRGQEAESQGVQKVRRLPSHGSGARRARFRTRGGGDDYRERRFVSWV